MSSIGQLLDEVSSDSEFELRLNKLTQEELLQLEASLDHGPSPSPAEVDARFGAAHARVRQIDRTQMAPLASELSFLADPGSRREWRGDTQVLWRIIEKQSAALRELKSELREMRDEASERDSSDLGLRLMLLRRELRDLVGDLSEHEQQTLLRLVVPTLSTSPSEPQKMRINEGLVRTLSELLPREILRDAGRWIRLNSEALAHFRRAVTSGTDLSTSDSQVLVTVLTSSVGYQFLQGSVLPFRELAFELFERLSKSSSTPKTPSAST